MIDTKQSMTAYFIGGCKKGSKPKCAHIPGTFLKHKINMHHRRARRMGSHKSRGGSLRVILELSRSAKLS